MGCCYCKKRIYLLGIFSSLISMTRFTMTVSYWEKWLHEGRGDTQINQLLTCIIQTLQTYLKKIKWICAYLLWLIVCVKTAFWINIKTNLSCRNRTVSSSFPIPIFCHFSLFFLFLAPAFPTSSFQLMWISLSSSAVSCLLHLLLSTSLAVSHVISLEAQLIYIETIQDNRQ